MSKRLPKEPLSHRIYLRISPTQRQEIDALAESRGIATSAFIRMLICNALARAKQLEAQEALEVSPNA